MARLSMFSLRETISSRSTRISFDILNRSATTSTEVNLAPLFAENFPGVGIGIVAIEAISLALLSDCRAVEMDCSLRTLIKKLVKKVQND
jgi:hypothetical protein